MVRSVDGSPSGFPKLPSPSGAGDQTHAFDRSKLQRQTRQPTSLRKGNSPFELAAHDPVAFWKAEREALARAQAQKTQAGKTQPGQRQAAPNRKWNRYARVAGCAAIGFTGLAAVSMMTLSPLAIVLAPAAIISGGAFLIFKMLARYQKQSNGWPGAQKNTLANMNGLAGKANAMIGRSRGAGGVGINPGMLGGASGAALLPLMEDACRPSFLRTNPGLEQVQRDQILRDVERQQYQNDDIRGQIERDRQEQERQRQNAAWNNNGMNNSGMDALPDFDGDGYPG